MDDDFWGGVFLGIIGIAVAIYLLYLFFVYVAPWLLLIGVAVGLPGQGLTHLLTAPRFLLTRRSACTVFIYNAVIAWLVTTLIIYNARLHPALALLLAPSCFYVGGLLVVIAWGGYRRVIVWKQAIAVQRREEEAKRKVRSLQTKAELLRTQITRITALYGRSIEQLESLDKQAAALCAQAPRVFGVIYQECMDALTTMSGTELARSLGDLETTLSAPPNRLRCLLLKREMVRRDVGGPDQELNSLKATLKESESNLQQAQETLSKLSQETTRRWGIYRAFKERPILL